MNSRRWPVSNVLRSGFVDLPRDVAREAVGGNHAREGTEAQNPAMQRAVETDVERHANAAGRPLRDALRGVPLPRPDVIGGGRLEIDLHAFGRPRMDAERMGKRRLGEL